MGALRPKNRLIIGHNINVTWLGQLGLNAFHRFCPEAFEMLSVHGLRLASHTESDGAGTLICERNINYPNHLRKKGNNRTRKRAFLWP